jgi:hypothetical protein
MKQMIPICFDLAELPEELVQGDLPRSGGAAIRREWFSLTARELLDPSTNLFVSRNAGQSYQPSPVASVACDDPAQYFEVAGRVVGLALLHAVPLDCRFTSSFLRQLLEGEPTLEDFEVRLNSFPSTPNLD